MLEALLAAGADPNASITGLMGGTAGTCYSTMPLGTSMSWLRNPIGMLRTRQMGFSTPVPIRVPAIAKARRRGTWLSKTRLLRGGCVLVPERRAFRCPGRGLRAGRGIAYPFEIERMRHWMAGPYHDPIGQPPPSVDEVGFGFRRGFLTKQ